MMMDWMKQNPFLVAVGGMAGINALVAALFAALRSYGINVTPELESLVVNAVKYLVPAGLALYAMRYTTSLARPRDNDGNPLVPVVTLAPDDEG